MTRKQYTGEMPRLLAKLVFLLTPKRRWFQFRLRSLFVLVVIATVPSGLLKWKMVRKEWERAVLGRIMRKGGESWYDWQAENKSEPPGPAWFRNLFGDDFFATVVGVSFQGNGPTDEWLVRLEPLTELSEIRLVNTHITDDAVQYLTRFKKVTVLSLQGTDVTDATIVHLKSFTELEELDLINTPITDAGLVHLKELSQLKLLGILDTSVTEFGIAKLQKSLPNCEIVHPFRAGADRAF